MGFSGRLRLDFVDGQRWTLVRVDPPFSWTGAPFEEPVVPPGGMVTDFGTIPHLLASWFPGAGWGRHGQWGPATVVHDWLYLAQKTPAGAPLRRSVADAVLWRAMRDGKVGLGRCLIIWSCVRLFGWIWWAWFRNRGNSDPLDAVMPRRAFPKALWWGLTGRQALPRVTKPGRSSSGATS